MPNGTHVNTTTAPAETYAVEVIVPSILLQFSTLLCRLASMGEKYFYLKVLLFSMQCCLNEGIQWKFLLGEST